MGQVAGWATADYLHQHTRKVRRTEPLPDLVWQALADHHHPDDTYWLAENAEQRHLHHYAMAYYRPAADAGDPPAAALRTPGQDDRYAEDRELLGLARIMEVPDKFSLAERQRAEDLAADPRIRRS